MNTFWKHYGRVALLMAGIVLLSAVITVFTGTVGIPRRGKTVVATTYPLFVVARSILGDTDGVALTMLSGVGNGCLHDYQLSPADRMALERADLVLMNGADAEPFLADVVTEKQMVDTTAGLTLLKAVEEHDHEEHDHAQVNTHVWMSPTLYRAQVEAVGAALCALDPANAAAYQDNLAAYLLAIDEVRAEIAVLREAVAGRPCVLFHDSLAYWAQEWSLDVKLVLLADGEGGASAADLAAVEALAREYPDIVLLYDKQYRIRYTALDALVPAGQVLALDTAVTGQGVADDWVNAMNKNLEQFRNMMEASV